MNAVGLQSKFAARARSARRVLCLAGGVILATAMTAGPAFAVGSSSSGTSGSAAAAVPSGPQYPVVASGLDNPRGLAFAPNGDIYVAEGGHGGKAPCIPSDDDPSVNTCFGTTGAIARIHGGTVTQVVTGLPSLAPQVATQNGQLPPGAEGVGPSDVTVTANGTVVFTVGLGANPSNRDTFAAADPAGKLFGSLVSSSVPGTAADATHLGDIAGFEATNNPVPPDTPDSNANAVIADGSGYAVVDAGGNDLLHVDKAGNVSMISTFPSAKKCPPPPVAPQAVPTSVARGSDGALYVGELTGFPFCEGGASIYRVDNGKATVYAAGLTNVTGVAFGPDGTLYAVEIAQHGLQKGPIGAVVAIPPGGGKAMADYHVLAAGLLAPYGIAIHDGSAYVTTGAILPVTAGGGNVVKISLTAPPPSTTAASTTPSTTASSAPSSTAPSSTTTGGAIGGSASDTASTLPMTGAPASLVPLGMTGGAILVVGVLLLVGTRRRRTVH